MPATENPNRIAELESEIERLKRLHEWQPIAMAPKSTFRGPGKGVAGVYLLAIVPGTANGDDDPQSLVTVIWWEPSIEGGCWCSDYGDDVKPTYWQHQPPITRDLL